MREALLTVHILGVALWLGGGMYSVLTFPGNARASSLKEALLVDEAVGGKYFGVAFVLLFGSGIGLVMDSAAIGWGTAFVLIGIGVAVVSGVLDGAVFGPRLKRMAESDDNDIVRAARLNRFAALNHLLLLGFAIWAMVSKLGL